MARSRKKTKKAPKPPADPLEGVEIGHLGPRDHDIDCDRVAGAMYVELGWSLIADRGDVVTVCCTDEVFHRPEKAVAPETDPAVEYVAAEQPEELSDESSEEEE